MMLPPFKLEEFWKKHEFKTPYLLCSSDAESWTMQEILSMADPEAKGLWDNLRLGYTEVPGLPVLREAIASLYCSLTKDDILTTAGAEEGIYCVLRTLLASGDHAIAVGPCYQSLQSIPEAIGSELSLIMLDPDKHWQLDVAKLENALRTNTKVIILNYPHNPTGVLLDKASYERIIELARSRGIYILSDEVYRYLEIDESTRLPALADSYEKGISVNVMTKSFGLAGLRIGWVACREKELIDQIASYKVYTSICNSAPSEILALIALRAHEALIKRNRAIMLNNLAVLDSFMEKHRALLRWSRPESGPMGFIELLLPIPIHQFTQRLMKEAGVLILPGTVYDFPGNYFRIGFGRKNMPEVLAYFEQFLEKVSQGG